MSKQKKDVVINMEPGYVRVYTNTHGFTLQFTAPMDNGRRRKIVNLKFEFWWTSYIARELWKAVVFWRAEVERCAVVLTNDPDKQE